MLNLNIFFRSLKRLNFGEFVCFLRTNVTILGRTKFVELIRKRTKFVELIRKRTNLIRRNVLNDLKTSTRMFIALDD